MQVVVTAVGPDHVGLADPLIHHVTDQGANIAEIQMYDHDEQALFAMLLRIEWPGEDLQSLRKDLSAIGVLKGLSVRVWSAAERQDRPRLAICTTYRDEPARVLLQAINDGLALSLACHRAGAAWCACQARRERSRMPHRCGS